MKNDWNEESLFLEFKQGTAFVQTNIPLAYQLAAAGGGSWLTHQPYIQMQHQLQPVRNLMHALYMYFVFLFFICIAVHVCQCFWRKIWFSQQLNWHFLSGGSWIEFRGELGWIRGLRTFWRQHNITLYLQHMNILGHLPTGLPLNLPMKTSWKLISISSQIANSVAQYVTKNYHVNYGKVCIRA